MTPSAREPEARLEQGGALYTEMRDSADRSYNIRRGYSTSWDSLLSNPLWAKASMRLAPLAIRSCAGPTIAETDSFHTSIKMRGRILK